MAQPEENNMSMPTTDYDPHKNVADSYWERNTKEGSEKLLYTLKFHHPRIVRALTTKQGIRNGARV